MTISASHLALYLDSEGDSVILVNLARDGATLPEQSVAEACKTRKQVLTFLESLNTPQTGRQIEFYHRHTTSYPGHPEGMPQGKFHPCALAQQIDFVRYKMSEHTHEPKHSSRSFCVIL